MRGKRGSFLSKGNSLRADRIFTCALARRAHADQFERNLAARAARAEASLVQGGQVGVAAAGGQRAQQAECAGFGKDILRGGHRGRAIDKNRIGVRGQRKREAKHAIRARGIKAGSQDGSGMNRARRRIGQQHPGGGIGSGIGRHKGQVRSARGLETDSSAATGRKLLGQHDPGRFLEIIQSRPGPAKHGKPRRIRNLCISLSAFHGLFIGTIAWFLERGLVRNQSLTNQTPIVNQSFANQTPVKAG